MHEQIWHSSTLQEPHRDRRDRGRRVNGGMGDPSVTELCLAEVDRFDDEMHRVAEAHAEISGLCQRSRLTSSEVDDWPGQFRVAPLVVTRTD